MGLSEEAVGRWKLEDGYSVAQGEALEGKRVRVASAMKRSKTATDDGLDRRFCRRLDDSGAGLFFHGGSQLEVAHEAMKIVGMDTEKLGGVGDISGGLLEGAEN